MKRVTWFRLRKDDLIKKRARIIRLIIKKTKKNSFQSNSLIESFNMENIFDSKKTIASKCSFFIYHFSQTANHLILNSYR